MSIANRPVCIISDLRRSATRFAGPLRVLVATLVVSLSAAHAVEPKVWLVRVVDGQSKEPLPNLKVFSRPWDKAGQLGAEQELISSNIGIIRVPVEPGAGAELSVRDPRFFGTTLKGISLGRPTHVVNGPADATWKREGSWEATEPGSPLVLHCLRGTLVKGRLVDPDGKPIAKASIPVGVWIASDELLERIDRERPRTTFTWDGKWPNWGTEALTDARGEFSATIPPANSCAYIRYGTRNLHFHPINDIQLAKDDPEHVLLRFAPLLLEAPVERAANGVAERVVNGVLDLGESKVAKGIRLRGRVLDAEGRPMPDVDLVTSGQYGPYAGRNTTSNAQGRFAFGPILPGELMIHPKATIRDAEGRKNSRDVRAVFSPIKMTLAEAPDVLELTIQAHPHKVLEFEWIDRRKPPGKVGYYDRFNVLGQVPQLAGEQPAHWVAETEKVVREGRTLLVVKVPKNLQNAELYLVEGNDGRLTYEDDRGQRQIARDPPQPGVVVHSRGLKVDLGDFNKSKRRVIYCDLPEAQ